MDWSAIERAARVVGERRRNRFANGGDEQNQATPNISRAATSSMEGQRGYGNLNETNKQLGFVQGQQTNGGSAAVRNVMYDDNGEPMVVNPYLLDEVAVKGNKNLYDSKRVADYTRKNAREWAKGIGGGALVGAASVAFPAAITAGLAAAPAATIGGLAGGLLGGKIVDFGTSAIGKQIGKDYKDWADMMSQETPLHRDIGVLMNPGYFVGGAAGGRVGSRYNKQVESFFDYLDAIMDPRLYKKVNDFEKSGNVQEVINRVNAFNKKYNDKLSYETGKVNYDGKYYKLPEPQNPNAKPELQNIIKYIYKHGLRSAYNDLGQNSQGDISINYMHPSFIREIIGANGKYDSYFRNLRGTIAHEGEHSWQYKPIGKKGVEDLRSDGIEPMDYHDESIGYRTSVNDEKSPFWTGFLDKYKTRDKAWLSSLNEIDSESMNWKETQNVYKLFREMDMTEKRNLTNFISKRFGIDYYDAYTLLSNMSLRNIL